MIRAEAEFILLNRAKAANQVFPIFAGRSEFLADFLKMKNLNFQSARTEAGRPEISYLILSPDNIPVE
jgi:hypothetical protein